MGLWDFLSTQSGGVLIGGVISVLSSLGVVLLQGRKEVKIRLEQHKQELLKLDIELGEKRFHALYEKKFDIYSTFLSLADIGLYGEEGCRVTSEGCMILEKNWTALLAALDKVRLISVDQNVHSAGQDLVDWYYESFSSPDAGNTFEMDDYNELEQRFVSVSHKDLNSRPCITEQKVSF